MEPIKCFVIVATDQVRRDLRRYVATPDGACKGPAGFHDASVFLDHVKVPPLANMIVEAPTELLRADARWPKACACGRPFKDTDQWQVFPTRIYERPGTAERYSLEEAPPGAMYDAHHFHTESRSGMGPDGVSLMVKLPGNRFDWWFVDGPSKDGGRWTRRGNIPRVTANPSIVTPRYHGWLRDGRLESV